MEKKNYTLVIGVVLFIVSLSAFFICLHYGSKLYMFWMIFTGCSIGQVIGWILRYKKQYRTSPKTFWLILLIAVCAIVLSGVLYFTMSNPIVYIILLNVVAMLYAVYLIRKIAIPSTSD